MKKDKKMILNNLICKIKENNIYRGMADGYSELLADDSGFPVENPVIRCQAAVKIFTELLSAVQQELNEKSYEYLVDELE